MLLSRKADAPHAPGEATGRRFGAIAVFAAFAFTGSALVLLGCILPVISAQWHLGDERLGQLLLTLFAGSACGALLVTRALSRSIVAGLLLTAGSAAALAFWSAGALALFFGYGLGLGWSMTAMSLLIGSAFRERSGAALTLLNFFWSAGATVCPLATHAWFRHGTVRGLFLGVAGIAGVLALVLSGALGTLDRPRSFTVDGSASPARSSHEAAARPRLLIFFATFAMLYVGVEASLGGWVLSYVHRMDLTRDVFASAAVSCFWLSLLAGRALAPAILLRMLERRFLVWSLLIAWFGILLLLTSGSAGGVLVGASLAGLGLAPVFPLCVSMFLALSGQSSRTRWLFAVSGVGGAVMPWLTGHVSARTGSLHAGLLVPLLAVAVMLGMLRLGQFASVNNVSRRASAELLRTATNLSSVGESTLHPE
jgi:MFS transporter, FHS family, glucose/mannose:H+ symporter